MGRGNKICITGQGHTTKVAATTIFVIKVKRMRRPGTEAIRIKGLQSSGTEAIRTKIQPSQPIKYKSRFL